MAAKIDNRCEVFNTHDLALAEMFFKIYDKNGSVIYFLTRMLAGGNIEPLRFVSRYILSLGIEPAKAKILLDRYIVVLVYACLKSFRKDEFTFIKPTIESLYLNEIAENGLTMEKLDNIPDDTNPFHWLINYDSKDYKAYKKIRDKLFSEIKLDCELSKNLTDQLNALKSFIDYRFNYFSINTKFEYFSREERSSDLLIAEARSYKLKRSFEFEIPSEDGNYLEYLKNLQGYREGSKVIKGDSRDARVILAFLVNDSITLNKAFNEVYTITSNELKCYELNTEARLSKEKKPRFSFLALDEYTNRYYPKLDRINEFKVKYNNELYMLSRGGLKKL